MKINNGKILITGGAGFIGSHITDILIDKGCHVRVIDNLVNGRLENLDQHRSNSNFDFMQGDITNPPDVAKAMEGVATVIHLACLGVRHSIKHPFENHRVNAEGALLLLKEAHKRHIERFLYCSSSEVYGSAESVPMDELHTTRPCTVYGAGKLAGEAYTRAFYSVYGLNTIVVRPFNVYGPRSHHESDAGEMIPKSIVRALNDETIFIFGNGNQTRDFTNVEDTAEAILKIIEKDNAIGQTFNIGSDAEIPINDIAKTILKLTGREATKIKYLNARPGDVYRLYANSTSLRALTDWYPKISFEEGLIKTIEYFRSKPEGISALLDQEKDINWI